MTKVDRLQPWKVLKNKDLHDGNPWVKLSVQQVSLPDGVIVDDFYRINVPDYTAIFAETPAGPQPQPRRNP